MQYLQIHELEQMAAQPLCAGCAARYEPCAAVWLQTAGGVVHVLPVGYGFKGFAWTLLMSFRFCDGVLVPTLGAEFCARYSVLGDMDFMAFLLQKYPELLRQPLVERVLSQLGVDLEAEIVMWQLSQ